MGLDYPNTTTTKPNSSQRPNRESETEQRAPEKPSENEVEGFLCFKKHKTGYVIRDGGVISPPNTKNNYLNNKKYSMLTFIPIILYNQFSFFFNLYFLFLCVTQFIPMFQIGFLVTYVGPLVFVLFLTMLKEGWDDFKRYKRDKKYNEELFKVLDNNTKTFKDKQSQYLQIGDIICLEKGHRVPADLIILGTKHPSGGVYLKTDQLDGETDWKNRESIKSCQSLLNSGVDISQINFSIIVPPPTNKIYEFRGTATLQSSGTQEPLRLQNTAWSSTTIASGDLFGLVVYVGKDTRIQMNANQARIKFPICDFEVNNISKFLFVFCLSMSFFLVAIEGFDGFIGYLWLQKWIKFLVLLCCIIPQSLRTNLDVVKLLYAYWINKDKEIDGTICRNTQMTEDLGRVNFLLSDKTGTLTKNEMIFKKITTGLMQFTEDDFSELKGRIKNGSAIAGDKLPKNVMDLNMLMYSLVLCNNVQPCFDSENKRFLQSSSPDEIALVEFAEQMGFFMHSRDRETIVIKEPSTGEALNTYRILDNFPFSSQRKRMGIILRVEKTGRIVYLLKGADTMIREKVERNADMVVEEADNLAREGLRTLAFCYKFVEQEDYNRWKTKYQNTTTSMSCTEDDEDKVISELEAGMRFIGVSGVEDLLQDSIRETIESLREAGIKVWVLTGDKVETAKCIAKSTGLKHKSENFFDMLDEDPIKIEKQILEISNKKEVLVIQGNILAKIYERGLEKAFFTSVHHLNAIMFCRCSPTQKAEIVRSVQKICSGVVLSIGDGGNDVSMIQQADVGVGIEGKEGLQAAMSSDFSILKFKYVKDLMFWHGRKATLSTAYVTLFVIHRGLIIAMIQFYFCMTFYLVAVPFYNAVLISAYTIIYLVLPVIVLATVEDVERYHALTYPKLYHVCQKSRHLGKAFFLMIFFKSIYQAMCIFTLTLYFLENSYLQIVTISFSALVFTELLNIFTLVDRLNKWIIGANSISLLFYLVSVIFFRDMLGVQKFDFQIIKVIFVITVVCWLPFELIKRANTYFFPTVSDKIMLTVKKRDREPNEMLETTPSSELLGESSNNEDYAKLSGDEKRTSF